MKFTSVFMLFLIMTSSSVLAGNLPSMPHKFVSGTAAKAGEVNANFEAVRGEVDDNANVIVTKQNKIDIKGCAPGKMIQVINEDGSVVCATDRTKSGWWRYDVMQGYGFPTEAGAAYLTAGIHLPNGVTISAVDCYFYDDDTTYDFNLSFSVFRNNINGTSYLSMANAAVATSGNSTTKKPFTDSSIASAVIDNTNYFYNMRMYIYAPTGYSATTDSKFRIYGCRISYTGDTYYITGGEFLPAFATGSDY